MIKTAIASTALFAAHALATGNAVVINNCDYKVYMSNTPSADGGYTAVNQNLAPGGGSYSQIFTELSNSNGWSLKLSKVKDSFLSDILQYEYTFHDDGIIWYDLSEVNGNPWDGNWEITATGSCKPRQAAYRFATDDAYGMQSCPQDSSITVTLCSGTNGGSGGKPHKGHKGHKHKKPTSSPPETSVAPAPTSEAPAPTSAAPVPTSAPASPPYGGHHHSWALEGNKVEAPAGDSAPKHKGGKKKPTTLETSSAPAAQSADDWDGPKVTVTNMKMETVTQFVTAYAAPTKRAAHVHHPRHPHHRI